MAFRTTTVGDHVIDLEQDGDDVNILVNGHLVAWFESETNTLQYDEGTLLDPDDLGLTEAEDEETGF